MKAFIFTFSFLALSASLVGCQSRISLPNLGIKLLHSAPQTAAPGSLTGAVIPVTGLSGKASASAGSGNSTSTSAQKNPSPTALLTDTIRVVAQNARPAVVQIVNQQASTDSGGSSTSSPDGIGSGVIYDPKGYILTNNHVVEGAQKLLVTLPDGRTFAGNLIGADPTTDLAVLQIQGDHLPFTPLGNSSDLQVGDWVVAIGNAFGLPGGPTVSAGVISAIGRSLQEPTGSDASSTGPFLYDLLQTDAPINPGNSGGPLISLAGEVVGINTLILGQAEPGLQAQGIGFAISTQTAKPIVEQLVSTGHVVHPYLGITFHLITPLIADRLGIKQTHGVMITSVSGGSPADQAGLKEADIITAIENQTLNTVSDLSNIVERYKPGDTIQLSVIRDDATIELKLTLGQAAP